MSKLQWRQRRETGVFLCRVLGALAREGWRGTSHAKVLAQFEAIRLLFQGEPDRVFLFVGLVWRVCRGGVSGGDRDAVDYKGRIVVGIAEINIVRVRVCVKCAHVEGQRDTVLVVTFSTVDSTLPVVDTVSNEFQLLAFSVHPAIPTPCFHLIFWWPKVGHCYQMLPLRAPLVSRR